MKKDIQIIIAGMGGQGIQAIAKIISHAAAAAGLRASYIPSFGVEQRGTPSIAFIKISRNIIYYPRFNKADLIYVLHDQAVPTVEKYLDKNTNYFFDSSTIDSKILSKNKVKSLLGLPATKLAQDNFNRKSANLIVAGHLGRQIGLPQELIKKSTEKILARYLKTIESRDAARQAIELGHNAQTEKNKYSRAIFMPSRKNIEFYKNDKYGLIVPERCKSCGLCILKCPAGTIKFGGHSGIFALPLPEVDLDKCTACGNCSLYCPDGAIKIIKK